MSGKKSVSIETGTFKKWPIARDPSISRKSTIAFTCIWKVGEDILYFFFFNSASIAC